MASDEAGIRIGELARRCGRSPDVLRAWERRYGLLEPARSAGGYRLYSRADQERVRRTIALIGAGHSTAEAARLALEQHPHGASEPPAGDAADALREAIASFDAARAHAAFDRLVERYSVDAIVARVVLPYLGELGERWACAEASVGEEHFASELVEGRLQALARDWDRGLGPRALLACPAGERHEHGLRCFGLALRARGWRITYLGADTPADAVAAASVPAPPDVVVLAAVSAAPLRETCLALRALRPHLRLLIGGAGADAPLAAEIGAESLPDEPLAAADALTADAAGR